MKKRGNLFTLIQWHTRFKAEQQRFVSVREIARVKSWCARVYVCVCVSLRLHSCDGVFLPSYQRPAKGVFRSLFIHSVCSTIIALPLALSPVRQFNTLCYP